MTATAAETPAMRQYWESKRAHPDALLLFRLGDFFELFFEDAVTAAPILGVTLTSRPSRQGRMPMCGVPHHSWQAYVGKLLRAGKKVVICDQVEAPDGKTLVRREVTRVLSPGTVVEEEYLDPTRSNWLLAAWTRGEESGLAACDVSTGEIILSQLPASRLASEVARLQPVEVLSPPEVEEFRFAPERGRQSMAERLSVAHPAAVGAEAAPLAVGALGVLLEYLAQSRVRLTRQGMRIRTYSLDEVMQIDSATQRNLELPALARFLDVCVTPIGSRRLRAWVNAPLRRAAEIEARLDRVQELIPWRSTVRAALTSIGDLERTTSRALQGLCGPRELAGLRRALEALPRLQDAVGGLPHLEALGESIHPLPELAAQIAAALVDEPPAVIREGGFIRPGYDALLDSVDAGAAAAREWIQNLEAGERERTGIKSLKVGFNRVFGYYLEVPRHLDGRVPAEYVRRQSLSAAERYITSDLKERESIVLNAARERIRRELEIWRELLGSVQESAFELADTCRAVGELDALAALAEVAVEHGWVRPALDRQGCLAIEAGRHPLVEASLPPGDFVANDLCLDCERAQVVILTGPNMAGKSTFLRQVALIVLLAQCGSFVPAAAAKVGVADRIFTRVGAHDDPASGLSTFMVEMTETANILNNASRDSLVVIDEVGRGTSTYDGLSIAQAVVEYLHDAPHLGCRTLFATHFHELTQLAAHLPRVQNQRLEVLEEGGGVRFLHRVAMGGADRSYGIHVAALAGLPPLVVERARVLLQELESSRPLEPQEQQLGLPLATAADPIRHELSRLELDRMSPLDALLKLYELRRGVEDRG